MLSVASFAVPEVGRVAQPDGASVFEAEGCGFEPCRGHQQRKTSKGDALVVPFVALASLLYAACRIRERAITTLSAGAKALSAGAKQEWGRCMRTLARLQLRVGTWMYRNAMRRLKRQSYRIAILLSAFMELSLKLLSLDLCRTDHPFIKIGDQLILDQIRVE